jgi:hypothetical protein
MENAAAAGTLRPGADGRGKRCCESDSARSRLAVWPARLVQGLSIPLVLGTAAAISTLGAILKWWAAGSRRAAWEPMRHCLYCTPGSGREFQPDKGLGGYFFRRGGGTERTILLGRGPSRSQHNRIAVAGKSPASS